MKKLVCKRWLPTICTAGHIYTLKDIVRDEGYTKFYQFEEHSPETWISEDLINSDFEPAENITSAITIIHEDGREDTRYFVHERMAKLFEEDVRKAIKTHNRKNAKKRDAATKIVDCRAEYKAA